MAETLKIKAETFDVGHDVNGGVRQDMIKDLINTFEKHKPTFVASYLGRSNNLDRQQMTDYMWMLDQFALAGATILHLDAQWNSKGTVDDVDVTHARGNISFKCNTESVRDSISTWMWNGVRHYAPKSTEDILTESFAD